MKKIRFSFEDLEVWQKAIEFASRVIIISEKIQTDRKHYRLIEQLESASTSIALNIAEGKGRYSKKEFIQFLYRQVPRKPRLVGGDESVQFINNQI